MTFRKRKLVIEKNLYTVKMIQLSSPPTIGQLYNRVRGIHYKSYFHYLYFNTVKWSYFQGMVIVPYLALAPKSYRSYNLGFRSTNYKALVG